MNEVLRALLRLYLSDPHFYLQLLLFVGLAAGAFLFARALRRAQERLPGWRWQGALGLFYFPLLGLIAGRILSELLQRQGWAHLIFDRLYALFWVLLFYRGALLFVQRVNPTDAPMIRRRILIPLALLFVTLRLAGQLGALLTLLNSAPLLTLGSGESAFVLTPGLLLFGPLTLALIYVMSQGIRSLLTEDMLPNAGLSASRSYAVGTLISYVLLFVGLVGALAALGIQLTTLAVVGSALAVGIGFGLQDTVNNLVSGFLIMFDPLLNVGDTIEVQNERGTIQRIGIRNSVIQALDGTQVVIPNGVLASTTVLNLTTSNRPVKVTLQAPFAIEVDPQQVEETLLAIVRALPEVRETPAPQVILEGFGAGTMTFRVQFWVTSPVQIAPATHALNRAIWAQMRDRELPLAPVVAPTPPGEGERRL